MYKLIQIALVMLAFSACKETKRNTPAPANEIPLVLQENKNVVDLKSYRGEEFILKPLFEEYLNADSVAKKLFNDLNAFQSADKKFLDTINRYNEKNETYYSEAKAMLNLLSDSVLKKQLATLITTSETSQKQRIQILTDLMDKEQKGETIINDLSSAVKVTTTLKMMEDYQRKALPTVQSLQAQIKEQEKLIERLKGMLK